MMMMLLSTHSSLSYGRSPIEFVLNLVDTNCTASVVDAVVVRIYKQQCQPSSGCAWPAYPKTENRASIAGGRGG